MVVVAQLVRAPDCGSGGHGFEPRLPPVKNETSHILKIWDVFLLYCRDAINRVSTNCLLFFYYKSFKLNHKLNTAVFVSAL